MPAIEASARAVEAIIARGEPVYGINTGFGKLASVRIAADDLARSAAQHRAVARGRGRRADAARRNVRLMMALKLASLGRGASGVRRGDRRHARGDAGARRHPGDPEPGLGRRLGRSRAARAHGGGDARHRRGAVAGERMPAAAALARAGLAPIALGPKEGLALLNGTQFSTAEALAGLFAIERVFQAALVTGALSTDAAQGLRHAVRSAHPRAARPSRPDRGRRRAARADGRQRRSAPRTWSTTTACRIPIACAASRR